MKTIGFTLMTLLSISSFAYEYKCVATGATNEEVVNFVVGDDYINGVSTEFIKFDSPIAWDRGINDSKYEIIYSTRLPDHSNHLYAGVLRFEERGFQRGYAVELILEFGGENSGIGTLKAGDFLVSEGKLGKYKTYQVNCN
ncbi:hypothetical protein N9N67_02580 [Bacteriovoracaceae bacterium]|nr:hypothetical protein [Bacteriovoracaceae bacterium]